jgi:hypothetical protein
LPLPKGRAALDDANLEHGRKRIANWQHAIAMDQTHTLTSRALRCEVGGIADTACRVGYFAF